MKKTKTIKQALLLLTTAILPLSATAVAASCGSSDSSDSSQFQTTSIDLAAADKTSTTMYDPAVVPAPTRLDEKAAQDAIINTANLPIEQQAQADQLILALSKGFKSGWGVVGVNQTTYPNFKAAVDAGLKPSAMIINVISEGNLAVMSAFIYAITKAWKIDATQLEANQLNVITFINSMTSLLTDKTKPIIGRISKMLENWNGKGANAMASWSEFLYAWHTMATDTPDANYSYTALRAGLMGNGEATRNSTNSITRAEFLEFNDYLAGIDTPKLMDLTQTPNIALMANGKDIAPGTTIINVIPKVAGSRIVKITNEDDAKTYILKSSNKAAEIIRTAIKEELVVLKKTDTLEVFLKSGKVADLGIAFAKTTTGVEITNLVINIVTKILNEVWQVKSTTKLDRGNLIEELLRLMTGADLVVMLDALRTLYQNFEGKSGPISQVGQIDYSWANLLHFVRLALDSTPLGNYDHEALYAMLWKFGKAPLEAFNNKMAEAYASDARNKPTGGYSGTKLNLLVRSR